MTEGSGAITVGDATIEAEAGTAIYLPPERRRRGAARRGRDPLLWLYDEGALDAVPSTWLE